MLIIIWLWKDVGSSLGESFCEKVGFALYSKYSWSKAQSLPHSKDSHKWRCFTPFSSELSNTRVELGQGEENGGGLFGFFFHDRYCLFGLRIYSFLGNPPTMCKKPPSLKYLEFGTWCMPRYGRKCFLVVSGIWEMVTLASLKLPKVPGLFASDPMCSIMVCLCVKTGILGIPEPWWVSWTSVHATVSLLKK